MLTERVNVQNDQLILQLLKLFDEISGSSVGCV